MIVFLQFRASAEVHCAGEECGSDTTPFPSHITFVDRVDPWDSLCRRDQVNVVRVFMMLLTLCGFLVASSTGSENATTSTCCFDESPTWIYELCSVQELCEGYGVGICRQKHLFWRPFSGWGAPETQLHSVHDGYSWSDGNPRKYA